MSTKRSRKPGRRESARKPASSRSRTARRGKKTNSGTKRRQRARSSSRASSARSKARWHLAGRLAYWAAVAGVWAALIVAGMVVYVAATFSDPLSAGLENSPPNVTILARDGTVLADRGLRRGHVRLGQLPPYVVNAVLATEDRRFYNHFGVDPLGLLRATVSNVRAGTVVQGGSTITQQLAKNLYLTSERTYARKFQEVLLALWLEARFTKDEILELYLNRVYFGAGAYGIEAAAQRYFGKSASKVTVSEAALLAGLLKAPSRYAPTRNTARAEGRASVVITKMVDAGVLSSARAMAALTAPASLRDPHRVDGYEYAVDWVSELLTQLIAETKHDIVVETTLDAPMQSSLQNIVQEQMAGADERYKAEQAAAVMMDTNGAVRAITGGRSYRKSQFNRAIKSLRQPGSAFKPFVFLAALEAGLSPNTRVYDSPVNVNGWRPKNYSGKYLGPVTMRDGLAQSINTVAVRVAMKAGQRRVVRTARRLGISTPMHKDLSIALGTAEVTLLGLTSAYAPFANGGREVSPHVVRRIRTRKGKTLYRRRPIEPTRVIERADVGAMNDMLNAVLVMGTGKQAALPNHPAAGKTGTSQNFRDAWFVGYTGRYLTGVWVGNDNGSPMRRVTGGSLPAKIWKAAMTEAHRGLAPRALPGTYTAATARRPARATRPARAQQPAVTAAPARTARPAPPRRTTTDRPFLKRVMGIFDTNG